MQAWRKTGFGTSPIVFNTIDTVNSNFDWADLTVNSTGLLITGYSVQTPIQMHYRVYLDD